MLAPFTQVWGMSLCLLKILKNLTGVLFMVAPQGASVHSLGTVVQKPKNTAVSKDTWSTFSGSLGSVGDGRRRSRSVKKITMNPQHHFLQEGLPDCLGYIMGLFL